MSKVELTEVMLCVYSNYGRASLKVEVLRKLFAVLLIALATKLLFKVLA